MDLLIVRHAIAFERDPKRWSDDRTRPLTPAGMVSARQAAKGLKRLVDRPQRLLTSPLARARQTAEILTKFADWPKAVEVQALAPGQSPGAVLDALRSQPHQFVAVVGHEPGLGQLIAACIPGATHPHAFELKKFGVVLLSFDGAPRRGGATLRWLLAPRLLRAVR